MKRIYYFTFSWVYTGFKNFLIRCTSPIKTVGGSKIVQCGAADTALYAYPCEIYKE